MTSKNALSRGTRVSTILAGGFAVVAFGLGFFVEMINLNAIMLVVFGIVGGFVLTLPYRWAIRLLFFYLSFEGMLKLITGYNPVVHVGADILVGSLTIRWFLGYLLQRERISEELPPLLPIFIAHFVWFILEFANPASLGLIPSIAGAKVYVSMVFLFFYGFYLSTSAREVRLFMSIPVITTVIQVVLSLYQGAIGPASVLMISPNYAGPLNKFQGFAFRPFGTTQLPGAPAIFISLAAPFILYFLFFSKNFKIRLALLALVPGTVVVMTLCQVRSALLKSMMSCGLFLILGLTHASKEVRKKLFLTVPVVVLVLAFAIPSLTNRWVEERSENAMALERTLTLFDSDHIRSAREGTASRIVDFAIRVPLGAGLSRTGAASGAFESLALADPYYPQGFFTDNFWAATIAEVGIPGSVILTFLILMILFRGFRGLRSIRDPELGSLQAAIFCPLLMVFFGLWGAEGLLYNPEASFFWFFAGVMMRIPKLDAQLSRGAV